MMIDIIVKYYKSLFIAAVIGSSCLLLLYSCTGADDPGDNSKLPVITQIGPQPAYVRDVVTILGDGFGTASDSSRVMLGGLSFPSKGCIRWDNRAIQFEIPWGLQSCCVKVVTTAGVSPEYQLAVGAFPPIEMVTVPAGEFLMGSSSGFEDEQPVHNVIISDSFELSKYEITRRVWRAVVFHDSSTFTDDALPANNISWEAALRFCNRLSQLSGHDTCYIFDGSIVKWDSTADGYRLPTEAEWEYACRAGTTGDFSGSGQPEDMGWFNANSGLTCFVPGQKQANGWGLYDMHGNLWEWCWDYYDDKYYSVSPESDPDGPGTGIRRVSRGGSYADGNIYIRSSNRTNSHTDYKLCGLRIARNKFE